MSLFQRNPNESRYVGGEKHIAEVIKNRGPGNVLIWLNPEEDFNNGSTLIVAEAEEALFFKDGIVEQVFDGGKYVLSTQNYPFISRLRNAMTGGISTFNCKVYFVRKASSMEIFWGTDSPIQVRDPVQMIATSVQGRGAFKIRVGDGKKFLLKLLGNNVRHMTQEEITAYFRSEMLQDIKSLLGEHIRSSGEEILGICAKQAELAKAMTPQLREMLEEYGVELLSFSISGLDIPEDDPNRQKLEAAYATKREAQIYGEDYGRFATRELLTELAKNPGGGAAATLGLGLGSAPLFAGMAQSMMAGTSGPAAPAPAGVPCVSCGAALPAGSKFCTQCGAKQEAAKSFCTQCGGELQAGARFCPACGAKLS